MEKFVLVNGYVSMDNSQLFLDINSFRSDLKNRGGWLGVIFAFLGISIFNSFRNVDYFEKVFHYIDFGLRILGMITIIVIFWYLIFIKKSKKKLFINDISTIELYPKEFETEVTIKFSGRGEIDLSFRKLENQLSPFLEAIKKRNTRVIIKDY